MYAIHFQIPGDFQEILLLLISNLIPLRSEDILESFFSLLSLILWPSTQFVLVSNTVYIEKNVYSIDAERRVE
jgi:hypothetical protein